jgi:hypothetical protein
LWPTIDMAADRDARSVLFQTIVPPDRRRSVTVQSVARLPVDAEPIAGLAERLDRALKGCRASRIQHEHRGR